LVELAATVQSNRFLVFVKQVVKEFFLSFALEIGLFTLFIPNLVFELGKYMLFNLHSHLDKLEAAVLLHVPEGIVKSPCDANAYLSEHLFKEVGLFFLAHILENLLLERVLLLLIYLVQDLLISQACIG